MSAAASMSFLQLAVDKIKSKDMEEHTWSDTMHFVHV